MLELPLLVVLVISVCFLTFQFLKINSVYEKRMHYYRFLPTLSMGSFSKELDKGTMDVSSKIKLTDLELSLKEMMSRIERQEAVLEKIIRGLGD